MPVPAFGLRDEPIRLHPRQRAGPLLPSNHFFISLGKSLGLRGAVGGGETWPGVSQVECAGIWMIRDDSQTEVSYHKREETAEQASSKQNTHCFEVAYPGKLNSTKSKGEEPCQNSGTN